MKASVHVRHAGDHDKVGAADRISTAKVRVAGNVDGISGRRPWDTIDLRNKFDCRLPIPIDEVFVPNIASAKKNLRKSQAAQIRNRAQRSELRTMLKKAMAGGAKCDPRADRVSIGSDGTQRKRTNLHRPTHSNGKTFSTVTNAKRLRNWRCRGYSERASATYSRRDHADDDGINCSPRSRSGGTLADI